jgi:phospholipase/carboxylesterase
MAMSTALDAYAHLFRPGRGGRQTLVLLHGTGNDEQSFARLAPVVAPDAAVLSIRGNVSERGLNRFFKRHGKGVYDMADLASRTRELIAFIGAAAEAHDLDRAGLVGVGYSNGANILANALFQDPSVVAAAVLLHPLIPFEPPGNPGLAGKRLLMTAGAGDPICPPHLSRALVAWFESQGAAVRLLVHEGGHELVPEEISSARTFVAEGVSEAE